MEGEAVKVGVSSSGKCDLTVIVGWVKEVLVVVNFTGVGEMEIAEHAEERSKTRSNRMAFLIGIYYNR